MAQRKQVSSYGWEGWNLHDPHQSNFLVALLSLVLGHNYEKVSHYYEKFSQYNEKLSHNYEKVNHYYDLQNYIFFSRWWKRASISHINFLENPSIQPLIPILYGFNLLYPSICYT